MTVRGKLTDAMLHELLALDKKHDGLHAKDVVAFARDATTALHEHPAFVWNVSEAAYANWLDAAGEIIRVAVTVLDRGDGESREMRTWVNVINNEGKHVYRQTRAVLRENRRTLITSTLDRICSLISSYPLPEFDPILEAVEEVRQSIAPRQPPKPKGKRKGGREVRPTA